MASAKDPRVSTVSGRPPVVESGSTPTDELLPGGQGQKADHWVLSEAERAKGYVRPVRLTYTHEKCGTSTRMPVACAETYARKPGFYGGTFCCYCGAYFPVGTNGEFVWDQGGEKVGT